MKNLNEYPLWTAIITPFDEDGKIDFESYDKLLQEQKEADNALVVLGSTGEALNMTMEERKSLLAYTFDKKEELDLPIMVGVGGSDLVATKEWISYLNTQPVDALLLVTPLYSKPETEGQYQWFKELMDLSEFPVMLYNVPGRTGKSMSFDAVKRLSSHPKLWAIKEASGSADDFKKYSEAAPKARVYSGDDGLVPTFAKHGCKGLVSVSSNAWPAHTHRYVELALSGELSDEDASLWDACAGALFCVSNPIPVKRLMAEEKRIATPVLKLPLSHKDLSQAATVLEASLRINDWYKKQNK